MCLVFALFDLQYCLFNFWDIKRYKLRFYCKNTGCVIVLYFFIFQTLCTIEAQLESLLGSYHCTMAGKRKCMNVKPVTKESLNKTVVLVFILQIQIMTFKNYVMKPITGCLT